MAEKNSKYQWGLTIACLGGLFTILGFDVSDDSPWKMFLLVGAVVLALGGLYMMQSAKKGNEEE
ncbi:MAG: hypothetical protein AAFY48_16295 [Bacteroidota bacterium]